MAGGGLGKVHKQRKLHVKDAEHRLDEQEEAAIWGPGLVQRNSR